MSPRAKLLSGSVQGNIEATERVELQATAIVTGDIEAGAILIHEGARCADVCPCARSIQAAAGRQTHPRSVAYARAMRIPVLQWQANPSKCRPRLLAYYL